MISAELGGQPHDACLWGDMIMVADPDGNLSQRRALTGSWRRVVEVDRHASVGEALSVLMSGLTRDAAKWRQFTLIHRSGVAVGNPPAGSSVDSLFSAEELASLASFGLKVDLYFLDNPCESSSGLPPIS